MIKIPDKGAASLAERQTKSKGEPLDCNDGVAEKTHLEEVQVS